MSCCILCHARFPIARHAYLCSRAEAFLYWTRFTTAALLYPRSRSLSLQSLPVPRPATNIVLDVRFADGRLLQKAISFLPPVPSKREASGCFCVCATGDSGISLSSLLTVPDGRKGRKSCSAAATFAVNRRQTERTDGRTKLRTDRRRERERLITSQEGSPCKEGKAEREAERYLLTKLVNVVILILARILSEVTRKLDVKTVQQQ